MCRLCSRVATSPEMGGSLPDFDMISRLPELISKTLKYPRKLKVSYSLMQVICRKDLGGGRPDEAGSKLGVLEKMESQCKGVIEEFEVDDEGRVTLMID